MADLRSIALDTLMAMLSDERDIRSRARALGVVIRQGKVDSYALLVCVVLGIAMRGPAGIASIGRVLSETVGTRLARSSVWDRFTPQFRDLVAEVLDAQVHDARAQTHRPKRVLRGFKDVLAVDATVVPLRDELATRFKATRQNSVKAALKVHTWIRALSGELVKYSITAHAHGDGRAFVVDQDLQGVLVLFDRGYSSHGLWYRIHSAGGYFLTPLPKDRDPTIAKTLRRHRGAARAVTGRKLWELLDGLQRKILDVAATFRCCLPQDGETPARIEMHDFRVIALRTRDGKYKRFVTNAPPELLPAEAVADVYKLRWEVETYFKTTKSGCGLKELSSTKKHIVETIVYAVLLRAAASMRALATTRARYLPNSSRWINPGQWHRWFLSELTVLRQLLTQSSRRPLSGTARLEMLLDPNRARPPTRHRIQLSDSCGWG
jgi:putative transposase